ncbi:uncharacterized protein F5891DRAFT_1058987 [Suillus fuscotomentosus]|uniref:MYND-type domain-containing protein n=1 Tax=Suillus fuscotomentosus TaxID=1912939 RepID=A0AAD4DZ93_9AGAM|nr:uncharacterized protein F5891DRAFT_1058987 [Suillus fuscotomentosus]KAG1895353.1 hypothetical protein F5891DRAFT_1058987 [Suillus fuscotomentosus]
MISAILLSQLPQDIQKLVQGVSNRSVADFEQLCDRLTDCSAPELCMLQPVFYIHLDPDFIPEKSTPAAITDIELAKWSLVGIMKTFNMCPGAEPERYLFSAWNRVTPWLVFFHSQFIMRRANHRPISRRLAVDVVGCILQHANNMITSGGDTVLITTPSIYHLLVELWLLALKIKDEDVLIIPQHPCNQSIYGPQFASLEIVIPLVFSDCTNYKAFMTTVLEVSGDIGTVVSTALEYVMHMGLMAQDPNKVTSLPTSLGMLTHTFSNCVIVIIELSKHSAAMREEFILRLSVKKIFLICRIIQLLFSSGESMDPTFGKSTLVQSFLYLIALLLRANNTVPVLHQALHSYAFEIAMGIQGPAVEVDLRDYKKSFLVILDIFLVYDKILTYAYKHVDAWSNALGPDVLPDETIRKRWSAVETKIRLYASLKSREEKIRRPSPDKKGWILRCYCGDTTEDTQLRQCSECQVVRYCSKRCQRDSWYSHHKWSCKFLKAAVGSSTSHYMKRSLCLLSGIEAHMVLCRWSDIQDQVAAARCKYPEDQDRLVVKITIDKEEISVQPLRQYLFVFNGLSENEVVDRLSSWPDPRGHLRRSFFCSVIAIHDKYSSQILFSPHTALDMETVPTLSRNQQYLESRRKKYESPMDRG